MGHALAEAKRRLAAFPGRREGYERWRDERIPRLDLRLTLVPHTTVVRGRCRCGTRRAVLCLRLRDFASALVPRLSADGRVRAAPLPLALSSAPAVPAAAPSMGVPEDVELRDSFSRRWRMRRMMSHASSTAATIASTPRTTITAIAQCGKLLSEPSPWMLPPEGEVADPPREEEVRD